MSEYDMEDYEDLTAEQSDREFVAEVADVVAQDQVWYVDGDWEDWYPEDD